MYRLLAHVLQKTGYFAVFVGFAYVCSSLIEPGRCKPNPFGLLYILVPAVTLRLVIGYGAFLRREIFHRELAMLWLVGVILFLAAPNFMTFYTTSWDFIVRQHTPDFIVGELIHNIGGCFRYIVIYWMPFAGLLSVAALVTSIFDIAKQNKVVEYGA